MMFGGCFQISGRIDCGFLIILQQLFPDFGGTQLLEGEGSADAQKCHKNLLRLGSSSAYILHVWTCIVSFCDVPNKSEASFGAIARSIQVVVTTAKQKLSSCFCVNRKS